ncbi:hypothetical protein [uncultured Desulfovibrio sp.]|uniref:hypothetical protein n=1 Tax=uncultured Desulfovibrio sp. TaxID=167968 RepID=UPI00261F96D2|nr:hypothetical protein [uncultured Desulfovibrio sp.]
MLLHLAVGVSRGEVRVVQDPDLHAESLAFVDDEAQVAPPAVTAEIGMGSALEADLVDISCRDLLQIDGDGGAVLAFHPEEGEEVVVVGAVHNGF